MKEKKMEWVRISFIVAAILSLLAIMIYSSSQVKKTLRQEMQKTLEDVATQNVIAVNKETTAKYRLLIALARELQEDAGDVDSFLNRMESILDIYQFKRIGFVSADGSAHTTDGWESDLSFREFFKQGMQGKAMITDVMEDAIGDEPEPINVFSVPVYNEDNSQVIGVLFATCRTRNFKDILSIECFDGAGYGCILNEDGDIIINSSETRLKDVDNILSVLESRGQENKEVIAEIKEAAKLNKSCTGIFHLDKAQYFYYTPLTEINDSAWYMLTIVPAEVLEQRMNPVMQTTNLLLLVMLGVTVVSIVLYIYSYHKTREKLIQLAYEDPLTEGPNYQGFKEKLNENSKRQGYIVAMDINEFKIVNSTCGVETGDEALRNIWAVLKKEISEKELAAHVNADRFSLFLVAEDKEKLISKIERLTADISAISERLNIPQLIPAFGIYYGKREEGLEKCYSCAIEAKHLIKGRRDRNYAFYDEVDIQQALEKREMEDNFEQAVQSRQFEVWYQPKFSVEDFRVVGAEALIRWRREDGTLIPPGKFIPVFERNGMISTLDEYIFREVCRQQKEWEKRGKKMFPVSVNISRASLYFGNIVEKYRTILEGYQLDAKYVELEITESATIDNAEISTLISKFHEAGFHLLLDDFGNGYSSLSSLNMMHFDTLKLDKSLVDYIGDENGETLLYYITKLAQNLGLLITAEGVETKEQVSFIQKLKCTDIQGFYFSKPLPVAEYEKLL